MVTNSAIKGTFDDTRPTVAYLVTDKLNPFPTHRTYLVKETQATLLSVIRSDPRRFDIEELVKREDR